MSSHISFNVTIQTGTNYQDGNYALFMSLFVSFQKPKKYTYQRLLTRAMSCFYNNWAQFKTNNYYCFTRKFSPPTGGFFLAPAEG